MEWMRKNRRVKVNETRNGREWEKIEMCIKVIGDMRVNRINEIHI